ncbi:unnamed protein product [Adineta steineri]|uniref:Uncharacterized protein n=1 Tax=Adineta steineri TaxID=433720 RepID=A0A814UR64_9BILA|nr:unnamed protein product [Adineta steineri]CAF3971350.1 unnamed protein product [Adineta steineri]
MFTLFKSDIVDKLMNANHSFSNLAYELHCTVQEIQSNLKETTEANEKLLNQVSVNVNELVGSISQSKNETKESEMLMNELNNSIETAREHVRLAEIAREEARRSFSSAYNDMQHIMGGRSILDYDKCNTTFSRFSIDRVLRRWCLLNGARYLEHKLSVKAMREASDKLKKQGQQLKDEIDKYNATQLQSTNIYQQLNELNNTLQEQIIIKTIIDALNQVFQLINNRLKTVSASSKRLLDVLMYMLDYETIVKSLNSIYDKLLNENLIESKDLKLSNEILNKTKQKLLLVTYTKSHQIRYRRKQFHHPCANR